jgi:CRISPR-associated endonuclease/helicase Cas3
MTSVRLNLEPHYEYYALPKDVPQKVHDALGFLPLAHQLETYKQLKNNHVVFNSFATGTGKTLAAYLHLLDRPQSHALVIAPTNALITQHAQDLAEFKVNAGIPHHIIEIDAARLRELKAYRSIWRNQEAFFRVLSNPYDFAEVLNLDIEMKAQNVPLIIVTNPDLFYYALYGLVNRIDRRNLTTAMFSLFNYIIIDEFHYYDARQFCAFLFFIVISHSLGFFEDEIAQRRIAILTATPNAEILEYFKQLSNRGLNYAVVSPEGDYPRGKTVRTLASMAVELTPFASRQSANLPDHISSAQLRQWLRQDMTGAVISDRLADVSVLSHKLRNHLIFEKVTGAVAKHDRPKILRSPLLLATPTVDIGYNFRREDKDRQNIDFLVFFAEYYDDFWQRIGRAGRVLGKPNQDFVSQVQALILEPTSEETWRWFRELDGKTLTHQELKGLSKELLASKPFNKAYIASEGLAATFSSFAVMLQSLPADDLYILEEALEFVQRIFAPDFKAKDMRHIQRYIAESYELDRLATDQYIPKPKLLEGFLLFREEPATKEAIQNLGVLLQAHQEARDIVNQYINARRAIHRARTSFRGSGDEIVVSVYDPQRFLTNHETVTQYDLLHLLRYFDLDVYDVPDASVKKSNLSENDKKFQVRLNSLLEPADRPTIIFRLQASENPEMFEKWYLRKLWAFQNLEIICTVGGALRQLSPKARQALKNTFLPMTLFDLADQKYIHKYLRDFKVYPREIEVAFVKYGESRPYLGIVGDLGEQALKHLERNKRWNRHISSFDIV